MKKMNMLELMERFHSEETCRNVLADLRWPDGVTCPRCQGEQHAYNSERFVWDCYSCGYQFSVLSGTIFHDTHLPLRKWFLAVLLMCESKKGISANQMKRILGVSYKTAWYLCHRIRAAMGDGEKRKLNGIVEVDETYIGGHQKNRDGRPGRDSNKVTVVGAMERGGQIRLRVVKDASRKTLHGFIRGEVDMDDTAAIYTDSWAPYQGIGDENTRHETVNHAADEWVRGDVHTNTAESVWSLLDRSIIGSFHHVSVKHLPAYLEELEWRFGNRENPYLFRDALLKLLCSENLEYKELIAARV